MEFSTCSTMSALKKLGILKHFKIWISTFGTLTSCTSQACKPTGLNKAQEQPQARHRVIDVATQPNYFNFKIAVTRIAFWFSTSSNKPSINVVFLLLNGFRFNLSRWSRFPASQNERSSQDKECDRPGFPRNPSRLTLCKPPLQMLWPLQPLRGLRVPAC